MKSHDWYIIWGGLIGRYGKLNLHLVKFKNGTSEFLLDITDTRKYPVVNGKARQDKMSDMKFMKLMLLNGEIFPP